MLQYYVCAIACAVIVNSSGSDSALERLQALQLSRTRAPSAAEYEISGKAGPNFLGRKTHCRCYTEANGTYFVEEISEHWTSRIWIFGDSVIWYYKDVDCEYAYKCARKKGKTPEEMLTKKGFIIGNMQPFDEECKKLVKSATDLRYGDDVLDAMLGDRPLRVKFRTDGFQVNLGPRSTLQINYQVISGIPDWKKGIDKILSDLESGKIAIRQLDEEFTFDAVMLKIAEENAEEVTIPIAGLTKFAKTHGHILPNGRNISVRRAVALDQGRSLVLDIVCGEKVFECLQYKLQAEWSDDGMLLNSPIGTNGILKSERVGNGQLMLVREGAEPVTCFIHRTGQTLVINGDFANDLDFRRVVMSLSR